MEYIERKLDTSNRFSIAELLIGELSPKYSSVLDLGAGHCRFSMMAAKAGLRVTAMDARTVRVPKDLPDSIRFVQGNFLDVKPIDDFDFVLMFGILYHLDLHQQKSLLRAYRHKPVMIDTHYCKVEDHTLTIDGYSGMLYKEGKSMEKMMSNPKASVSTLASFWHTLESLKKMLGEYYSKVTRILPEHYPERTFFLCQP